MVLATAALDWVGDWGLIVVLATAALDLGLDWDLISGLATTAIDLVWDFAATTASIAICDFFKGILTEYCLLTDCFTCLFFKVITAVTAGYFFKGLGVLISFKLLRLAGVVAVSFS